MTGRIKRIKRGRSEKNEHNGSFLRSSNLTKKECEALKSLKKKIKEGDVVVTPTDKSSRLAIMTKEQYQEAGSVHTSEDKRIDWNTVSKLQRNVNSHVWWLAQIVGYSKNKDQKRMMTNLQDYGREVPEMVLLCKDHKKWNSNSPVPTRPVISGNKGINTHLSELLSELLEPVSFTIGGGEIASTEEALHKINNANDMILRHEDMNEIDALEELSQNDIPHKQLCRDNISPQTDDDSNMCQRFNLANVSGNTVLTDLTLDSEEEEVYQTLQDLERESGQEVVLVREAECVNEKGKKITDFFPKVEEKRFFFSNNISEKNFRALAIKTKDFDTSVRNNCIAGRIWNGSRRREKERRSQTLGKKVGVHEIQDKEDKRIFFDNRPLRYEGI